VEGAGGAVIDLAGVGGTGIYKAIEVVKNLIHPNGIQTVYMSMSDNLGNALTGRTIYAMVHYPNSSTWIAETAFTEIGDGLYKYEFVMPNSGSIPYGGYYVHITTSGINEVRTFDFEPTSDVIVRGHLESEEYLDWSSARIENGGRDIFLYAAVQNQLNQVLNLTRWELWDGNYFLAIDSKLKQMWDSLVLYDETDKTTIDGFEDGDVSDWSYSGDVINLTIDSGTVYSGRYSLNVTLNNSSGSATLSKNFTSQNLTDTPGVNMKHFDIVLYLSDITILENISVKLKTNETDYYLMNRTPSGWNINRLGWRNLQINLDYATAIGSPDSENITGIEITLYGTDNYAQPTTIYLDYLHVHEYDIVCLPLQPLQNFVTVGGYVCPVAHTL